jgi:hypothetical protein
MIEWRNYHIYSREGLGPLGTYISIRVELGVGMIDVAVVLGSSFRYDGEEAVHYKVRKQRHRQADNQLAGIWV